MASKQDGDRKQSDSGMGRGQAQRSPGQGEGKGNAGGSTRSGDQGDPTGSPFGDMAEDRGQAGQGSQEDRERQKGVQRGGGRGNDNQDSSS